MGAAWTQRKRGGVTYCSHTYSPTECFTASCRSRPLKGAGAIRVDHRLGVGVLVHEATERRVVGGPDDPRGNLLGLPILRA